MNPLASATFQLLLIEDHPDQWAPVIDRLREAPFRFEWRTVSSAGGLQEALMEHRWSAVFVDAQSNGGQVGEIFDQILSRDPDAVIFVVSGAVGEERAAELMRRGARDFIARDNLSRLVPALCRELSESQRHDRQREVERQLQESEKNFRRMVESLRDYAILALDEQGRMTSWNPGAQRIFGYSADEVLGQSAQVLLTEDDQRSAHWARDLARAEREGQIEDERWQRRKNGHHFYASSVLTVLRNDDESLRGYALLLRDNTHKKLAMEQLEEARRRAESASRAKTQFLANMSHEIRTPLGVMLGFTELLLDPAHGPEEKENFARTVLRNGQQLSRIINDVLDVSKMETNRLETEKADFSLPEFLVDLMAMLRLQVEEKGLELVVTTEGPVPRRILTDPARLRQILAHLVGNAIKFTDAGVIELKVRSVSSPQTHSSMILEFEVKDTGSGISQDNLSKLFQPFTQGDEGPARKFGGTGLGLYLSRKLAQALGGDLVLRETSENRGSTFVFTVDAGPFETDVTFYTERSALGARDGGGTSLYGTKILVVDDSPDNRLLVRRILEHSQAEIETAENGLQAVESAKSHDYDLVLMDIQMPVMDGYEAFRQLREQGFRKPIVALTAHALHAEREHCFSLGFDDHLSKPIDRKVLIETIQRLTHRAHARPNLVALRPLQTHN